MLHFCIPNLKVSHVGKIIIVALVLGLQLFDLPNVSWRVLMVVRNALLFYCMLS